MVVVYVTREHPLTGADELLVLEEDGELRVPEGDDPAGAVREQAGIDGVQIVRELAPGFLQARADGELPERWQHGGLLVRWSLCAPTCSFWRRTPRSRKRSSVSGSSRT
jgi:hypothetical protein